MESCCSWWGGVNRGVSEEPAVGAVVIKCINCLGKEVEGLLVLWAALTLVFVTGFNALKASGAWAVQGPRRGSLGGSLECNSHGQRL